MTVAELRLLIQDMPAGARVLVPGQEHDYHDVNAYSGTALWDKQTRVWTEDYGEEATPKDEFGQRLQVLIIR